MLRQTGERRVRSLYDKICLRNVNDLVKATVQTREILIHLEDHDFRLVENALRDAGRTGEIKIPVLIHRCDR